MVKNWADHCSSDEEEEVEAPKQIVEDVPHDEGNGAAAAAAAASAKNDNGKDITQREHKERIYEYPTEPPFTAFVGNIAYSITDGDVLAEAVLAVASEHLQTEVKIISARIMRDRHNYDKHRGFGYVEVESVADLQKLMELNTCEGAVIAGRRVQLDTATGSGHGGTNNNNRRGSRASHRGSSSSSFGPGVDGHKFRGGRYANNKESGGSSEGKEAAVPDPPAQRTSLNLKPRSKPAEGSATQEGSESNLGGSSSSIFGAAKARDELSWQERRKSGNESKLTTTVTSETTGGNQPQQVRQNSKSGGNSHRGSGRGASGRGGRGGVGRGERDDRHHKNKTNNLDGLTKKSEKQQPKVAAPVVVKPAEPEKISSTNKLTNTFAALAFDSDSD